MPPKKKKSRSKSKTGGGKTRGRRRGRTTKRTYRTHKGETCVRSKKTGRVTCSPTRRKNKATPVVRSVWALHDDDNSDESSSNRAIDKLSRTASTARFTRVKPGRRKIKNVMGTVETTHVDYAISDSDDDLISDPFANLRLRDPHGAKKRWGRRPLTIEKDYIAFTPDVAEVDDSDDTSDEEVLTSATVLIDEDEVTSDSDWSDTSTSSSSSSSSEDEF